MPNFNPNHQAQNQKPQTTNPKTTLGKANSLKRQIPKIPSYTKTKHHNLNPNTKNTKTHPRKRQIPNPKADQTGNKRKTINQQITKPTPSQGKFARMPNPTKFLSYANTNTVKQTQKHIPPKP